MSEIKVNKISPRSGTAFTLGDSGDTFTIPSGATINNQGTAVNFGATGSASWVTTVKTSTFTAVAGEGYFVNTTGGVVSVNLPAGTAGAVVAIKDYAKTFDTNKVTLIQNGSDKIGGSTTNAIINTEGIAITLVFVDSTQGWLVTDDGLQSTASTAQYITATGGTITTVCTNFKVHTFTGPGTFCVSAAGNACGSNTVSYVAVAGGGGGVGDRSGGGGAGGYREGKASSDSYTASPIVAPAGLPVSVQGYGIVVGSGGAGVNSGPGISTGQGNSGSVSTFSTITSAGGGKGNRTGPINGGSGGSGGGGGFNSAGGGSGTGGSGNTPPVSPPQGNSGGNSGGTDVTGGGGGATSAGATGPGGKAGGTGATSSINGTPTARAGGGGGIASGAGGTGGGGTGSGDCSGSPGGSTSGTTNTGGGGGGGGSNTCAGSGGSGIVIIRYKFQN